MSTTPAARALAIAGTLAVTTPSLAQDWASSGGNAQRNGLTPAIGPTSDTLRWSGGETSVIAWQPIIVGQRVFIVRQNSFIPNNTPNDAPIIAYDLATGDELWRTNLPYDTGDWTTWIAGASQGKLYASRSGNGASVSDIVYALDQATGDIVWTSDDPVNAGFYDGVVFAPNGDPIIADFTHLTRIDHTDGSRVYRVPRQCSVSGSCGGAIFGDTIYLVDPVVGGHELEARDLTTGALRYTSEIMVGFTIQQTPFVGPDGTVYLARTQNNPMTDFFYAFDDTGAEFQLKWHIPYPWTTNAEFAADNEGVYVVDFDGSVVKLAAADGAELARSSETSLFTPSVGNRMALDGAGNLFVSNGDFNTGQLFAFDTDLEFMWTARLRNVNIGGPAIASDGTLVIARTNTDIRAYRTSCDADFNTDDAVDVFDILDFLTVWNAQGPGSDFNTSGTVDIFDIIDFLTAWNAGCP